MHSLYTSWLSVKISSLTKDWLLRNLCQQLTHFLMREPGTAVNMDHYFEKKLWKFSFYLMFYLLQLEFQVKSCFFGFLFRRCTVTLTLHSNLWITKSKSFLSLPLIQGWEMFKFKPDFRGVFWIRPVFFWL